jgi:hypothetical protein
MRLIAVGRSPAGSFWRIFWRIVAWPFKRLIIPLASPFLIITSAIGIGPAVAAAQGHGTQGYFVPMWRTCGHAGCSWGGDFTLPGGQITRVGVNLDNPQGKILPNVAVPALDTGELGTVFSPHGSRLWIMMLTLLIGGIAVGAAWIWWVPVRELRRERLRRGLPVRGLRRRRRRRPPDFLIPRL